MQETDIAALVDQQAPRAGVGVTEFFLTVAPINLRRAPVSAARNLGRAPPAQWRRRLCLLTYSRCNMLQQHRLRIV